MASTGSVTHLLRRLLAGEKTALGKILDRFWSFLLAVAGKKLKKAPRRAADEEDVAQKAAWDLYRGIEDGRWQQLANRKDLVTLLTLLTERKAINQVKQELARKRGAGCVQGDSALGTADGQAAGIPDSGPSPEDEVLQREWRQHCLDRLPDQLRPFAELHLAGSPVAEIAETLQCSDRTVARKLALIRAKWLQLAAACELPEGAPPGT